MFDYLKFTLGAFLFTGVCVTLYMGGHWLWLGFPGVIIVWLALDPLLEESRQPEYRHTWAISLIAQGTLVVMAFSVFTLAWITSPGDLLSMGAFIQYATGFDAIAAREANTWFDYVGAALALGLIFGNIGFLGAHEFAHHTGNPVAMFSGRWLLALTAGYSFEVGHNWHHAHVGDRDDDPASSRRGDNLYYWLGHNMFRQVAKAWQIERERLFRRGQSFVSLDNVILRSSARIAVVIVALYLAGGWFTLLMFGVAAAVCKLMVEALTYYSHYGIVRVPGKPVEVRHAWNANTALGNWLMFNIGRHSDHHQDGTIPFWKLKPGLPGEAPVNFPYFGGGLMAFVPPLFHKLMSPRLLKWDEEFATPEERELAREQNETSGVPLLMAAAAGVDTGGAPQAAE